MRAMRLLLMMIVVSSLAATYAQEDLPGIDPATVVNLTPIIGQQARVNTSAGDSLRLRQTPGGDLLLSMDAGLIVEVIGGPEELDGRTWWQVQTPDGTVGWTVGEFIDDEEMSYTRTLAPLCPFSEGRIAYIDAQPVDLFGGSLLIDDIYTSAPDGSDKCNLTHSGWQLQRDGEQLNAATGVNSFESLTWSPDGSKLAFTAFERFAEGGIRYLNPVYTINADGSGLTVLTPPDAWYPEVVWSPDGTRIAYLRRPEGRDFEQVWLMNSDGSNPRPLTSEDSSKRMLTWLTTDEIIFSVIYQDDDPANDGIFRIGSDGSSTELILPDIGAIPHLNWSPDGSKVAISDLLNGNDITIYGADGTLLHDIENAQGDSTAFDAPAWAPDGQRLAFWHWYSSADGSRLIYDLLMVTPGEGEPQVLVADVAYPIGDINTPTKP
ncbi:MAG: PD40 domain-containing protein, partial [Anaerolineae bacterium]|nr:PD40 domain-containing protein [Anaerolineae bacterium]